MHKSKIGKTISYFRKQAGLTQKQLADMLCVSDKAVSKWERGLSYPDITFISKLSKIFDTDVDALFIEEDRLISERWCGFFYYPQNQNNIKLSEKIGEKYILDIIISYYLLVSINNIVIICDGDDCSFVKKHIKKLSNCNLKFEVFTYKEFINNKNIRLFKNATNVMLIYNIFFIYGVGLTSSFQRAMIEKPKLIKVSNPNIPLLFGDKKHIIDFVNKTSSYDDISYMKFFRGYLYMPLNSNRDIIRCDKNIKVIENICGFELYNIKDIMKNRGIV